MPFWLSTDDILYLLGCFIVLHFIRNDNLLNVQGAFLSYIFISLHQFENKFLNNLNPVMNIHQYLHVHISFWKHITCKPMNIHSKTYEYSSVLLMNIQSTRVYITDYLFYHAYLHLLWNITILEKSITDRITIIEKSLCYTILA